MSFRDEPVSFEKEFGQHFIFNKQIGKGAFSKVILAQSKITKEELAVKVLEKAKFSRPDLDRLSNEAFLVRSIKNKFIINIKDQIETSNFIFIVMEYYHRGNLSKFVKEFKIIPEEIAAKLVKSLLNCVACLHEHEIIHRDIKLDNLLISNTDEYSVVLCDFGLSSQNYETTNDSDYSGTLSFMAPEQIEKRKYSKSVDLWSCGIVLYMILSQGKHPFFGRYDTTTTVKEKIKRAKMEFDFDIS